ncbi:glycoside hydrolase family 18 protein [Pyronema omphalodes]|nr:glycoside hydrolase family 18 protein [Pyronema omphalodes]
MKFTLASLALSVTAFAVTAVNATFDLNQRNNLVVYWGQNAHGSYDSTAEKQQKDLLTYCQDTNVDLISIGFVNTWNSTGGQPVVNFANSCTGYKFFPGTDLLWCPTIASDIIACQALGKKILISLGGGTSTYTGFSSAEEADAFAYTIWNAFGRGWSYYRPFGGAVVDGFDLDIEKLPALYYEKFAYRIQKLAAADTSKRYYLTAAPQCPIPDAHLTTALSKVAFDAIFVQFYNNPGCSADMWTGAGGFQGTNTVFNFGMWDSWVKSNAKNPSMKIFMGLPASSKVAPNGGYVSKAMAANIVADLARFSSFGGVSLWDASEAVLNTGYIQTIRDSLSMIPAMKKRGFFGLWA